MSEWEGRTEQKCHMFLAVKAPKVNDIFSARWWQVHSQVLNVVIDSSKSLFLEKDKIIRTWKIATQEVRTWSISDNGFVKDPESKIIYIYIYIYLYVCVWKEMEKGEIIHNWTN